MAIPRKFFNTAHLSGWIIRLPRNVVIVAGHPTHLRTGQYKISHSPQMLFGYLIHHKLYNLGHKIGAFIITDPLSFTNMSSWTHLIRFIALEDSQIHLGQLVDPSRDIGLDSLNGQEISAYLIDGTIFNGRITNRILHVKQVSLHYCRSS